MYKIGLKLWSTNKNYVNEARRLYDSGMFDYIELFSVPNTYSEFIDIWKALKIPYVIHGPHYTAGLNFADKNCFEKNVQLAAQAQKFADALDAEIIIFHPGVAGDIQQTIFQLNKIKDSRIVIENKPYFGFSGSVICNGSSPEEINKILEETGVGFCLDIAHAICAANAHKINQYEYVKEFIKLKPKIFHISGNDILNVYDEHRHLYDGNYDLQKMTKLLPESFRLTLETPKDFKDSLKDFESDLAYFKKYYLLSKESNNVSTGKTCI